jgi:hypothetical protein
MGIPYSKQINAAFGEVTPLVAAGFHVLRTSRNISILLAVVQIVTVILLGLILIALLALLITVSPDLEHERRTIVTPTVKWMAGLIIDRRWLYVVVFTVFVGVTLGGLLGWHFTRDTIERNEERGEGGNTEAWTGEDVILVNEKAQQ